MNKFMGKCAVVLVLLLASLPSGAARDTKPVSITAQVIPLIDSGYYPAVHRELRAAKESIFCAMYLAGYNPRFPGGLEANLLAELAAAHERGVRVSVILDGNMIRGGDGKMGRDKKNDAAFTFLSGRGVNVSYDSDKTLLHSKLLIIDEIVTVLGSTNWTHSALRKNHETSVIIRSRETARVFREGFQAIEKQTRGAGG